MMHDVAAKASDGFLTRLSRGDHGLARTYWLFGVFGGFVANLIFSIIPSPGFLAMALLVYTIYQIPVFMGIWRSATRYTGHKVWAILAKMVCVLGTLMLVSGILAVVVRVIDA